MLVLVDKFLLVVAVLLKDVGLLLHTSSVRLIEAELFEISDAGFSFTF